MTFSVMDKKDKVFMARFVMFPQDTEYGGIAITFIRR